MQYEQFGNPVTTWIHPQLQSFQSLIHSCSTSSNDDRRPLASFENSSEKWRRWARYHTYYDGTLELCSEPASYHVKNEQPDIVSHQRGINGSTTMTDLSTDNRLTTTLLVEMGSEQFRWYRHGSQPLTSSDRSLDHSRHLPLTAYTFTGYSSTISCCRSTMLSPTASLSPTPMTSSSE